MFDSGFVGLMLQGIAETLYMTIAATAASYLLGLPMGVVLNITAPNGIRPNRAVNTVLGTIVNIIRSVPFIILLVAVIPVTRFIVGTSLGSSATIVPLVIGAAPFVARLVETSLGGRRYRSRAQHGRKHMAAYHPRAYKGGRAFAYIKCHHRCHDHTWLFRNGGLCGRRRTGRDSHKLRLLQI